MRDIAREVRECKFWVEARRRGLCQRGATDGAQDIRHRRGHLRAAGDPSLRNGLIHKQDLLLPSLPVEDGDHALWSPHVGDPAVWASGGLLLRQGNEPAQLRGGLRQRLVRPIPHDTVGGADRQLLEELPAVQPQRRVGACTEKLHTALADGYTLPAELHLVGGVQLLDEFEEAPRLVLEAPQALIQGAGDDSLVPQG